MLNTAPSRSIARRTRQFILWAFLAGSSGVFLVSIGMALYAILMFAIGTQAAQMQRLVGMALMVLGGFFLLAAFGFLVRALVRRRENDLALLTGEYLSEYLDERYRFIRNINQPVLGYIDALLIGPPGLLVFRIVDETGVFLNERGNWARRNRQGDFLPWKVNPTKETIIDVKAVQHFLARENLSGYEVYGVVVFLPDSQAAQITTQDAAVPVAHLDTLIEVLKPNYLATERIRADQIDHITRLILGDV